MRNMELPDNLIDQIHYDICHGRLKDPEIRLTAEQMKSAPQIMGRSLHDGMMLLGKVIRLTESVPDVVYPPETPNGPWRIGTLPAPEEV